MPRRTYVLVYALALVVYAAVSGPALLRQSSDPHFVLQATAWLSGDVPIAAPRGDDWATVETVELVDGRVVRGRRLSTRPTFRTTRGEEVAMTQIATTRSRTVYMSFPAVPAVLMLPAVAIWGSATNDVLWTVLVAALAAPLCLWVLMRSRTAGWHARPNRELYWLTAAFSLGTVFFFASVGGKVWFTAHVVGVVLALLYLAASIPAPVQRPILAGVAFGLAAVTRTPMAFMFPLFLAEAWRIAGGRAALTQAGPARRALVAAVAQFAVPATLIAVAAATYNYARFDSLTEFGHAYLNVRQQAQIERLGLFSYQYLGRNLAVLLTLLPEVSAEGLRVSGHGLAIWITSPFVLYLVWPRHDSSVARSVHRALWLTVVAVALPTLFYQNSGWVQFGYRFALDYWPFLLALWAVGARPLTNWVRAFIIVGIVVNCFGAITFGRSARTYRTEGRAYDTVVAH